jgi:hypothetical protein
MLYNQLFAPSLIMLAVFAIIFLACREVMCWYLKINKTIALLEKIEENTRKQNGGTSAPADITIHDTIKSINNQFKI